MHNNRTTFRKQFGVPSPVFVASDSRIQQNLSASSPRSGPGSALPIFHLTSRQVLAEFPELQKYEEQWPVDIYFSNYTRKSGRLTASVGSSKRNVALPPTRRKIIFVGKPPQRLGRCRAREPETETLPKIPPMLPSPSSTQVSKSPPFSSSAVSGLKAVFKHSHIHCA